MNTTADLSLPLVSSGKADPSKLVDIPAGTSLYPVATDNSTYLDLWNMETGETVRLNVTWKDYQSNQFTEDGRPLDEVFEIIYWAG